MMVVGGKAFNLMKLAAMGFPVPPAFVLPTSMCAEWVSGGTPSVESFRSLVTGPMDRLERASGLGFGDPRKPLLVSVRSGAPVSMPGMLDTVLNVGLTRTTLPGLVASTGNPRLAWDCFKRLIESYAETVQKIDLTPFTEAAVRTAATANVAAATDLDTLALRDLALKYLDIFAREAGEDFPEDPFVQLLRAVEAVFRSWNSERARHYRQMYALSDLPGTAVAVQRMVYGNGGPRSGSGVGFTRDPATGERRLYLDFAVNAQGEDVVSGRHHLTPPAELARLLPETGPSIDVMASRLEQSFGDAQDFEFTIDEGQFFLLQTRDAKRSGWARLKMAVDMVREGLIKPEEALRRLVGLDLSTIVRRRLAGDRSRKAIAKGEAAGLGVATGGVALSLESARAFATRGQKSIFVRNDVAADDIEGIASGEGILTARGGRTSHAAVVARELGKVAIVGCDDLRIASDEKSCTIGSHRIVEGDEITLDGDTGNVYLGRVAVKEERPLDELREVETWRRKFPKAATRQKR